MDKRWRWRDKRQATEEDDKAYYNGTMLMLGVKKNPLAKSATKLLRVQPYSM
jgi:hypothetical protein